MNPEQIIQMLFGGEMTIDSLGNIFAILYGIGMSIKSFMSTKKLIKADRDKTAVEEKLELEIKANAEVKKATALMMDMMTTAFLSSTSIDVNTKKKIAGYADTATKLANLEISRDAATLIDVINTYIPGSGIAAKKEEILDAAKSTESVLDTISEKAQAAVAKISL